MTSFVKSSSNVTPAVKSLLRKQESNIGSPLSWGGVRFKWIPAFAGMTCGIILLSACSKKKMPAGQFAVPVTTATVSTKDIPLRIESVGNVESVRTVSVKALVSGEILKVHFEEGQDVKKGDLLFTIDPRPFQMDLAKNEANLRKDIAQARYAREEVRRYGELIRQGYVSEEQYDQVRTNASAFDATVALDKSVVDNAKLQLQYCYIRSPINGRTGSVLVHEGNLVKANDTPALLVINQIQPIRVLTAVPQERLEELKTYMARGELKVEAIPASENALPVIGKIDFFDNAVDPTTGTVKVKGIFQNEAKILWPGRFVNIRLTLRTDHNAIVVPAEAIQTGQKGSYVFVVASDMTAQIRPVVVDRTQDGEAVIKEGLKAGETVVTDGQLMLGPGAKVAMKNMPGTVPERGQIRMASPKGGLSPKSNTGGSHP